MKEVLQNIDWIQFISVLWTVVLLPVLTYIGTQLQNFIQAKLLDKYTCLLYQNVTAAVKDVYETSVKNLKGTSDWTGQKQAEVKQIAKQKAVHALSNSAYRLLRSSNADFEEWLNSLIGTALYDLKHSGR